MGSAGAVEVVVLPTEIEPMMYSLSMSFLLNKQHCIAHDGFTTPRKINSLATPISYDLDARTWKKERKKEWVSGPVIVSSEGSLKLIDVLVFRNVVRTLNLLVPKFCDYQFEVLGCHMRRTFT